MVIIKKETVITYKIISLGTSGVGKTSIFKRLLNEKFEISYNATIYLEISVPYYVKYKNVKYIFMTLRKKYVRIA